MLAKKGEAEKVVKKSYINFFVFLIGDANLIARMCENNQNAAYHTGHKNPEPRQKIISQSHSKRVYFITLNEKFDQIRFYQLFYLVVEDILKSKFLYLWKSP